MPFKLYIYFGAFVTYCDPILVVPITHISQPNPMFDHLLESSHRDDSNKWSNIGFCEEIRPVESVEVSFKLLIWSSGIPNEMGKKRVVGPIAKVQESRSLQRKPTLELGPALDLMRKTFTQRYR